MLIWAGKGIWAAVIPAFFWLIGGYFLKGGGATFGALLGAGLVWYFGRQINEDADNEHTLFFIPMQWAAWAMAVVLVLMAVGK